MVERKKKHRYWPWITSGLVVSLLWLYAAWWLISQTKICSGVCAQASWVEVHLSCLKAGELGDLLAGVLAPVAFFWFVIAIFVQLAELKASREEFEASRVAQQQMLEHDLFNQKSDEFDALASQLAELFRYNRADFLNFVVETGNQVARLGLPADYAQRPDPNFLKLVSESLRNLERNLQNLPGKSSFGQTDEKHTRYIDAIALCRKLGDASKTGPPANETKYVTYGIQEIQDRLLNMAPSYGIDVPADKA